MDEIEEILLIQKRELETKSKEKYVERDKKLSLKNDLIKVIIGPRRAGKSFFAIHFLKIQEKIGYVNFDDEKLVKLENYNALVTALDSIYEKPKYILFDEIQNLPNWELFVNRLQRQGKNLIITGSNSNLLSKELSTHLTGRHLLTIINPFSYKEYLKLEEKKLTDFEKIERLNKHILQGGYPEVLFKEINQKEYLSTLFNAILYKDIVKRYKIRNPQQIENLAIHLISNVAKEYSYNSLTKIGNIKSSITTKKYLDYLEESFILFSLPRFSYKVKEQLSSNKKIYCVDTGFINAKAFKISSDMGRLYENLVACRLKELELSNKINFYYWKNQQQEEVDFVIKQGTKVTQLIQICYNLDNEKTNNREIRALLKASAELNCENLLIITENKEEKTTTEWFGLKGQIKFIPLWKWLLEN